jgi:hypothetical protein
VSAASDARGQELGSTLLSGAEASELRLIERALKLRIERKRIEYGRTATRAWFLTPSSRSATG